MILNELHLEGYPATSSPLSTFLGSCVRVQVVIFAFLLPRSAPTWAWTDSPKKKKRSEVLNEIMEHLEEEDNDKDEDI